MPELSERHFCDGLEMKFTSPLDVIEQAGAPGTAVKSINSLFYFRLVITSAYTQVCISLSLTSVRSLNLRWRSAMAWILQHLHYTQYLINHGQLVNHSALIRFDCK